MCKLANEVSRSRRARSRSHTFQRTDPASSPAAVFDVLFPEDSMTRLLVKLVDCQAMGIAAMRVIDPKTHMMYRDAVDWFQKVDPAVLNANIKGTALD